MGTVWVGTGSWSQLGEDVEVHGGRWGTVWVGIGSWSQLGEGMEVHGGRWEQFGLG